MAAETPCRLANGRNGVNGLVLVARRMEIKEKGGQIWKCWFQRDGLCEIRLGSLVSLVWCPGHCQLRPMRMPYRRIRRSSASQQRSADLKGKCGRLTRPKEDIRDVRRESAGAGTGRSRTVTIDVMWSREKGAWAAIPNIHTDDKIHLAMFDPPNGVPTANRTLDPRNRMNAVEPFPLVLLVNIDERAFRSS